MNLQLHAKAILLLYLLAFWNISAPKSSRVVRNHCELKRRFFCPFFRPDWSLIAADCTPEAADDSEPFIVC
jgi:hypothetical protein